MKIVHLCLCGTFTDGFSYQENMLAKYHAMMGYDVSVITSLTYYKNGKETLYEKPFISYNSEGVKIIRLDYRKDLLYSMNRRLRRFEHLYKCLESEQADMIFIHGTAFCDAVSVVRLKRHYPCIKIYADSHTDWINSARNWLSLNIQHKLLWKYTTLKISKVAEKVWGVTPLRCEFLRDVYNVPASQIEYLPLGVDDLEIPSNRDVIRKEMRKSLHIPDGDFVILTGGKIDELKNIHLLMQAVQHLENVSLVIFGTVFPEFEHIFNKCLGSNICYLGWCDAKKIINLMVAADLACFPGTHSTLWEQSVGLSLPCVFKYWRGMDAVNVCDNCVFLYQDSVSEIESLIRAIMVKEKYEQLCFNSQKASSYFYYSQIAKRSIGLA